MNRREFGLAASATALSLSVVNQALAQTPPTLLPLSAWGALPAIELVALSADASRLAFVGVAGEQRRLILQTLDGQVLAAIGLGDTKVVDIAWAGNDDIVITTSKTTSLPEVGLSKREFFLAQSFSLTKKRFLNLPGSVRNALGFVRTIPQARVVNGAPYAYFSVFNIEGDVRIQLVEIALKDGTVAIIDAANPGIETWKVNENGVPVARSRYDQSSGRWAASLRRGANWPDVFQLQAPLDPPYVAGLTADGQGLVVGVMGEDGYTHAELRLDADPKPAFPDDGRLYRNGIIDPGSSRFVGGRWFDQYTRYAYFDPAFKASWEKIERTFRGQRIFPQDWSADRQKVVVLVEGAENSGTYYFVDLAAKRADIVGEAYPQVTAEHVGPVKPYSFKASDGREIPGFLTLPPGKADAKGLPLIVHPHGGPQAHDQLTFDWWPQAMASRGYAVLQPNFRGSTGYGLEHLQAGYGQWGRKMQSDLSDGVRALAAEGVIDPKRVAIVGASYGGYAAMAGVTLDSGVYRCAVAVAGVSDLGRMLEREADDAGDKSETTRYWKRFMGASGPRDPALTAISPALQAAKASAPILLIHGKDDTVVPYQQSVFLADALRKAGKPVELVTLKGEDHNLARGDTRLQMLEATLAFLQTHNPAG